MEWAGWWPLTFWPVKVEVFASWKRTTNTAAILQTFVRDRTIFDTGVHYIGGLSEGQNLHRYFDYLGILDGLQLKRLNEDGFDIITFDNDEIEYPHAQGYENFKNRLVEKFPEEEEAIAAYCNKLQEICGKFPLYNLKAGKPYGNDPELFEQSAKDYIDSLTQNKKLRAVLAGSNILYAVSPTRLRSTYMHFLSILIYKAPIAVPMVEARLPNY